MKIIGLKYFRLTTDDMKHTCEFYENLGGEITCIAGKNSEEKVCRVRMPDDTVFVVQKTESVQERGSQGWDHIAFQVDDCEEACKRIQVAGGKIEKYPTNNKMGTCPILNAVTYGINGEKIEIIQLL